MHLIKLLFLFPIEAFAHLKCPECTFESKEKVIFQNHAIENHPLSHGLFGVSNMESNETNFLVLKYDPSSMVENSVENASVEGNIGE